MLDWANNNGKMTSRGNFRLKLSERYLDLVRGF